MLPLTHDEVVHLKRPLLGKMPGSHDDERFANLRSLYAGCGRIPASSSSSWAPSWREQREWSHDRELDWGRLADRDRHAGVQRLARRPERLQAPHPVLHARDGDPHGFRGWPSTTATGSVRSPSSAGAGHRRRAVCVANLGPSTARTTASASRAPARGARLLTSDDARLRRRRHAVVAAPRGEPYAWQGAPHVRPSMHASPPAHRASTSVPESPTSLTAPGHLRSSSTGTSTNRRARTRGRGRCPSSRGAAPFHDWNERITAECYRPNGGPTSATASPRSSTTTSTCPSTSGPTLLSWLEAHDPDVYARILEADRRRDRAIAQAYGHAILPLCNERDLRTQVRWGMPTSPTASAGPRAACGCPRRRSATRCSRVLAEEGIAFTILAPRQIGAVRPRPGPSGSPTRMRIEHPEGERLDTSRPLPVAAPRGRRPRLDLVVYDGAPRPRLAFSEPERRDDHRRGARPRPPAAGWSRPPPTARRSATTTGAREVDAGPRA